MIKVVIPTLNAEGSIKELLKKIQNQTVTIDTVIVVDSSSDDQTVELVREFPAVELKIIPREEFDHGRTRSEQINTPEDAGDITVFMTQDAMPVDEYLIERLVRPLREDETVAITYARQIARTDAKSYEKLIRQFNYPSKSVIKNSADIPTMGIKTFFCSDVCAAYNDRLFKKLGGFDYPITTNEDMLYAAKAVNAGYKIAYVAEASVYHSHNYTLKEEFRRNYNAGYELEKWKSRFNDVSDVNEGKKLVKYVSTELLKRGKLIAVAEFGLNCAARLAGNRTGRMSYVGENR